MSAKGVDVKIKNMAEMGLGYGSEYQLLRYLGHHRNELNKIIREQTRLKGELEWLDFPKDNNRLSLDGEYKGVNFLKGKINECKYDELRSEWNKYWRYSQNWDGVILHKKGNSEEWIIVEAKANLEEIKSNTNSSSKQNLQNIFQDTQKDLSIENRNWFGEYYQLANRLTFVHFLNKKGINASLLYIYFLNGYEKCKTNRKTVVENKSVERQEEWQNAIQEEYEKLGINSQIEEQYISKIFIDCK